MKKTKLLTIAILISLPLFITGCGAKNEVKQDIQTPKQTETKEQTSDNTTSNIKGTFLDLIGLGKSVQCTFSSSSDDVKMEGQGYSASGKMATTYSMEMQGRKIVSHSIIDSDWMYIWTDLVKQGTKIQISKFKEAIPENKADDANKDASINSFKDKYDFNCIPWTMDDSKFKVPSDIQFSDMTQLIDQMKSGSNSPSPSQKNMCGVCNSLKSSDEIAKCKQKLGC